MRQWLVDPQIMCRKHLLGEHVEHHMFVGSINKGASMDGFLANNLLEPARLSARHTALVEEMNRRGYHHKSPLPHVSKIRLTSEQYRVKIDKKAALVELLRRCPECCKLYEEKYEHR